MVDAGSNVIVQFPFEPESNILDVRRLSKDKIDDHLDMMREYVVDEMLEIIVPPIYNALGMAGFPVTPEHYKDASLISEVLKSYLLRRYGVWHPFHQLADESFVPTEDEEQYLFTANTVTIDNVVQLMTGNN